ncbi:MAG: hypothetical protein PHI06_09990 [Desulfobulbaceae bacterium]|nr:hypothetical protein [Desulfobulbaceae bacterium]
MTFHCKNFDINADRCNKLKGECIPGRRGCVLEGKVKLSEELQKKVDALNDKGKA